MAANSSLKVAQLREYLANCGYNVSSNIWGDGVKTSFKVNAPQLIGLLKEVTIDWIHNNWRGVHPAHFDILDGCDVEIWFKTGKGEVIW